MPKEKPHYATIIAIILVVISFGLAGVALVRTDPYLALFALTVMCSAAVSAIMGL